jgi:hypothetical protein
MLQYHWPKLQGYKFAPLTPSLWSRFEGIASGGSTASICRIVAEKTKDACAHRRRSGANEFAIVGLLVQPATSMEAEGSQSKIRPRL